MFYNLLVWIFESKSTRIEMDIRPLLTVVWYGLVPKYWFQNMETALIDTVTLRNLFRNRSIILFCRSFRFLKKTSSTCDDLFFNFEPDTKL